MILNRLWAAASSLSVFSCITAICSRSLSFSAFGAVPYFAFVGSTDGLLKAIRPGRGLGRTNLNGVVPFKWLIYVLYPYVSSWSKMSNLGWCSAREWRIGAFSVQCYGLACAFVWEWYTIFVRQFNPRKFQKSSMIFLTNFVPWYVSNKAFISYGMIKWWQKMNSTCPMFACKLRTARVSFEERCIVTITHWFPS